MEWDATYAIGQSAVDGDHQRLFQLFNRFSAAIAAGERRESANRFLRELADYSAHHFRREEGLMRAVGYPDYAKHKAMHDSFADFVRRQSEADNHDLEEVQFLQSYVEMWLCGHILVMDKWFGEWLDGRTGKSGAAEPIS